MRQVLGMLISILLHGGVVASALIYFPAASRIASDTVIIPIELVTLADTSNVRAARPEPEPELEEPAPEEDQTIAEVIEPEPEPEPVIPEPEPEIIPPAPREEPEPVEADPEPEPEPPAPQPEPEPEPDRLNLGDLSRLVDRSREARDANRGEAGDARRSEGAGTAMTATLQAMAASQIQRCVRSNADAPLDMDLRVIVEVRLERDGSLASAPQLRDQSRILNSTNPFLRVAGERALRAVIDCAPYQLPAQNYQEWRLLEVNVDTQRGR